MGVNMVRMFIVSIVTAVALVQLTASTACGREEPWASDVLKACDTVTGVIAQVDARRRALHEAGMPELLPGDADGLEQMSWLARAGPAVMKQYREMGEAEALLRVRILDLYFLSSIGEPILEKRADRILPDALQIVAEYRRIVGESASDRFEDVFVRGLEQNLLHLKGPYYRQVAIMFCRHARIRLLSTLSPDDMGPPETKQQETLRRVFSRWYHIDLMQYGYQWSRDRVPYLLPAKGEQFNLAEDTL